MQKDKLVHWYLAISISLIVIFGCILFFYKYIDGAYYNQPLIFESNIATPDKTEYKIGDKIAMRWSYCKNRNLSSTLGVTLINDVVITLPNFTRNVPTGCVKDKDIFMIKIPTFIHTGEFIMHVLVSYDVNPMKTVKYNLVSKPFKITD